MKTKEEILAEILNCYDQEELHSIGASIDSSFAPREVKVPLYEAVESQLKKLSSTEIEHSAISLSDVDDDYSFEE